MSRLLEQGQITLGLLDEIQFHQDNGNVQLLRLGSRGGEVDIPVLRVAMGGLPVAVVDPAPVVREPAPTIREAVEELLADIGPVKDEEPEPLRQADEAEVDEYEALTIDSVLGLDASSEDEFVASPNGYTKTELSKMTNDQLRGILTATYKVPGLSGKSKGDLVEMVLEAQDKEQQRG
jgi:hypothetical protein